MTAVTAMVNSGRTARMTERVQHPNILLMLGDDHRWDGLGCMGNQIVQTPHLDRLGQEGSS